MRAAPANHSPIFNMDITLRFNDHRIQQTSKRMELSSVLNPWREDMDVQPTHSDGPMPSYQWWEPHFTNNDMLPPMACQQPQLGQSLPPLKSLFQTDSHRRGDSRLHCTRLRRAHSSEGIVRNLHNYPSQSPPLETIRAGRASRSANNRSAISARSLRSLHRISRRSSPSPWDVPVQRHQGDGHNYIRPAIAAEDPNTYYDCTDAPPSRKRSRPHSNKPYTIEQVDWIRYHAEDRDMSFKAEMMPLFWADFPDRHDPYVTEQTLSARHYRANMIPKLDERGEPIIVNGRVLMVSYKIRDRNTEWGKKADIPTGLVDAYPWRLVTYTHWKSPVLEKDMERAKQILAGNDPSDLRGSK
jgi:hypothetical protein